MARLKVWIWNDFFQIYTIFQTVFTGQNTTNNKTTTCKPLNNTNCISSEWGPVLWNNVVTSFMGTRFPLMTCDISQSQPLMSWLPFSQIRTVQDQSPAGTGTLSMWIKSVALSTYSKWQNSMADVSELAVSFNMRVLQFQITVIRSCTYKPAVLDRDCVWESCHSCITSKNVSNGWMLHYHMTSSFCISISTSKVYIIIHL